MTQKFTSQATSIKGEVVAAIRNLANDGYFQRTDHVLDYGAGKYARNSKWLRDVVCLPVFSYDKFNYAEAGLRNGWDYVVEELPVGFRFDVGFTSYVLNVVPEAVEAAIVAEVEEYTKGDRIFHITRGTDVENMVFKAVSTQGNRFIRDYIFDHYPSIQDKIDLGDFTKDDAKEVARRGVQTSRDSFQRVPDLTKYGYKKMTGGASVVWMKEV